MMGNGEPQPKANILPWNHFYLWGPMFVNYPKVAGLLGRNFVGSWFVALQCEIIPYFVVCSWM